MSETDRAEPDLRRRQRKNDFEGNFGRKNQNFRAPKNRDLQRVLNWISIPGNGIPMTENENSRNFEKRTANFADFKGQYGDLKKIPLDHKNFRNFENQSPNFADFGSDRAKSRNPDSQPSFNYSEEKENQKFSKNISPNWIEREIRDLHHSQKKRQQRELFSNSNQNQADCGTSEDEVSESEIRKNEFSRDMEGVIRRKGSFFRKIEESRSLKSGKNCLKGENCLGPNQKTQNFARKLGFLQDEERHLGLNRNFVSEHKKSAGNRENFWPQAAPRFVKSSQVSSSRNEIFFRNDEKKNLKKNNLRRNKNFEGGARSDRKEMGSFFPRSKTMHVCGRFQNLRGHKGFVSGGFGGIRMSPSKKFFIFYVC